MARSNPLMMFAKHIAAELAAGGPGEGFGLAMAVLDGIPDAAPQLLELVVAESRRKRPDEDVIEALAVMLGHALETLRFGVEAGETAAKTQVDGLRAALKALVQDDTVNPNLLLLLVRQFTIAGVDPGDELRSLLVERVGDSADVDEMGDGDPLGPLAMVATQVDDEFTLFSLMREMTGALPDDHRAMLATAAFAPAVQPVPGLDRLREASLGWLFDPAPSVRRPMAAVLGDAAGRGGVSGTMLRRMIALRNWLPEQERAELDDAIRKARSKGVAVTPTAPAMVREVLATGWDGAGSQSIFFVLKDGRRFAVAALLLKQEFGVRDAWVQRGGTKRDVEDLLGSVRDQVGLAPSTVEYAAKAAAYGLGINAVSGVMPPFGLIEVAELAGLTNLQPETVAVETLVASLCEALPPAPDGDDTSLRVSETWTQRHPFTQSWFEGGAAVEELLGRKKLPKAKAVDLILGQLLEERRLVWAERMAWVAATLRPPESNGKGRTAKPAATDWADFARVAHALLSGRPLRDIPIMVTAAQTTVEAFAGRRRR